MMQHFLDVNKKNLNLFQNMTIFLFHLFAVLGKKAKIKIKFVS